MFKYLEQPDRWPPGSTRHPIGNFYQVDGEVQIAWMGLFHRDIEEFHYVSSVITFTFFAYLAWVDSLPNHWVIVQDELEMRLESAWQKKHGRQRCPKEVADAVRTHVAQALPTWREDWKLLFSNEAPDRG